MPKGVLDQVFDPDGYLSVKPSFMSQKGEDELPFRYKVLEHTNGYQDDEGKAVQLAEKLVITYSEKRAQKDRAERSRLIEKALFLLAEPAKIKASNKKGGKRFILHQSENDQYCLDEKAIASDEQFDGYYAIQTSVLNFSAESVLEAYHTLWKIEESFRVMKSTLEVRPIFHWTEQRIKGHFVVCFLSFLLERTLEYQLKKNEYPMSPLQIREALNSLLFTELEIHGQPYLIKMKPSEGANKILRLLHIAPPKNILPVEEALEFTW